MPYSIARESDEVVRDLSELLERREDVRIFTPRKPPVLVDEFRDRLTPERLRLVELALLHKLCCGNV